MIPFRLARMKFGLNFALGELANLQVSRCASLSNTRLSFSIGIT
jgi:hypothetical protein